MHVGCRMVIREKFSTSNFWSDVRLHGCTAMVYVGELWRYLHTATFSPTDKSNPLRVIAGNGLRSDIWSSVCERFGIERVVEHYGMTEMPAGPYMNFYGRIGACGYIPPSVRKAQGADTLVKFDVEAGAVERDPDTNYCVELTTPSTPGEALFLLAPSPTLSAAGAVASSNPHTDGGECDKDTGLKDPLGNVLYKPYRNYTSLAAAEKRVYRNVFSPLDAWFATGDLLKLDEDGFFYFCDRIGDTFRWKGENVATNDVAEVLCAYVPPPTLGANQTKIKEANVYGVEWPGQDGKAGMACLVLNPVTDEASSSMSGSASVPSTSSAASSSIDFSALLSHLLSSLPSFAVPAFLRIKPLGADNSKTSTLKFQKVLAQSQGFDPMLCDAEDELWFWPGAKLGKQQQQAMAEKGERIEYVRITPTVYQQIVGAAK